jgi:hypothetical protein
MARTMNLTYWIDDVALDDPQDRWWVLDDTTVAPEISRRDINMLVGGLDGAHPAVVEAYELTTLNLQMVCRGSDTVSVEEVFQALTSLMSNRARLVTVKRLLFGHITTAQAKLASIANITRIETGDQITFTALFTIPDVFFRDVTPITWDKPAPVSGTIYNVESLSNSGFDITDSLIKLVGPMTTPVFRDVNSGGEFSVKTLAAGQQALIDCYQGTVTQTGFSAGMWTPGNGNDISYTLRTKGPSSGRRTLWLTPGVVAGDLFDRRISVAVTASGMSGTSRIAIRARRTFL